MERKRNIFLILTMGKDHHIKIILSKSSAKEEEVGERRHSGALSGEPRMLSQGHSTDAKNQNMRRKPREGETKGGASK